MTLGEAFAARRPIEFNITGLHLPATPLLKTTSGFAACRCERARRFVRERGVVAARRRLGASSMHWVKPRVATTVRFGTQYTVRASCGCVAGDRLIVELPGFSASGSSIPLDDGIWGASAAWDSQRLTFRAAAGPSIRRPHRICV